MSKALTRQQSKRAAHEFKEEVEAMGQENELQGIKWTKEVLAKQEREEKKFEWESYEAMKKLSRNKKDYFRMLSQLVMRFTRDEKIDKRWKINLELTDQGVVAGIEGTDLYTAFKPTGIPRYDFLACKTMAIKLGNTTSHLEGYRSESAPGSGVLVADELDTKKIK